MGHWNAIPKPAMTPEFLAYFEREGCRQHGEQQDVMWAAWSAARRNHERVALSERELKPRASGSSEETAELCRKQVEHEAMGFTFDTCEPLATREDFDAAVARAGELVRELERRALAAGDPWAQDLESYRLATLASGGTA